MSGLNHTPLDHKEIQDLRLNLNDQQHCSGSVEFHVDFAAQCFFERCHVADQYHVEHAEESSECEHSLYLLFHQGHFLIHVDALCRQHIESDSHAKFDHRLQRTDAHKSKQPQHGGPLEGLTIIENDGLRVIVLNGWTIPLQPVIAHEAPDELAELPHGVELEGRGKIHVQLALVGHESPRVNRMDTLAPAVAPCHHLPLAREGARGKDDEH
mmetsp:Transcript_52002/g.140189  ORF Transcript_52002/g.140189 Transcript_52002/m.140189 type:complete len:212 (-) Transcript_52002:484-1119(-)